MRLVAAKGRMYFEGFALSKMIFPEDDPKPFRSIARAGGSGPADGTCDVDATCSIAPLASRQVTFVKTQAATTVRAPDNMRSYGA